MEIKIDESLKEPNPEQPTDPVYTDGVGILSSAETTRLGIQEMTGTTDPYSDNFGNYVDEYDNVSVCIPAFYYRVGSQESPNYSKYTFNTLDICSLSSFKDEEEANANNWILHRAFIDEGVVKPYFLIWKYNASKNGTVIQGKKGYEPVCCTSSTSYGTGITGNSATPNCTGIYSDAISLCRSLGYGWNAPTIFMYSALSMISMSIGQNAKSATDCAWYDNNGIMNFPKGCNNNALGDRNDSTVKYAESSYAKKPLTGSGTPFSKTTHNGKNNGVCDLNGGVYNLAWGLTWGGATSATSSSTGTGFYVLKHSTKFADMTGGWNTGFDIWGNDTHLAKYYDLVTYPGPTSSTYWGSTTASSFFTNKTGVKRDLCGFIPTTDGVSSSGTNLFGNDYFYYRDQQNSFPLVGGYWSTLANYGVFYRDLYNSRSYDHSYVGFRAASF